MILQSDFDSFIRTNVESYTSFLITTALFEYSNKLFTHHIIFFFIEKQRFSFVILVELNSKIKEVAHLLSKIHPVQW